MRKKRIQEMKYTDIKIKFFEHGKDLGIPQYMTEGSAGLDLKAAIEDNIILRPFERYLIPTGIAIALPNNFEAQIRPRSGLSYKNGVTVLNTPGTIDSDYRGELKVLLINLGNEDFIIERGARIAQLVLHKYEKARLIVVDKLDETIRSANGYGSTGLK
ncbi:MAG: dUTP diphosphatase [Alphaproteobacteria bacterium]|nr:dUTP diphosphatase [Alphaproteobacteria bacterium]